MLHAGADKKTLQIFTKYILGIWLFITASEPFTLLADFPAGLAEQTSVFMIIFPKELTDRLYAPGVLWGLKVSLILVLAAAMIGKPSRAAMTASSILATLFQSVTRSFGHMGHQESILLQVLWVLTLFKWCEDKNDDGRAGVPLVLWTCTFVLLISYTFAGVHRLIEGGLGILGGESINFWLIHLWYTQGNHTAAIENFLSGHLWFQTALKAGFVAVSMFEVLAVFCIYSRKLRIGFLAVMIPFHIICWQLMGIFFWENMLLYVLLIDGTPFRLTRQPEPLR